MTQSDIDMYEAWMRGDSIGSIAKRHKLDKTQVRRIVNRVMEQRSAETVLELQGNKAGAGRNV